MATHLARTAHAGWDHVDFDAAELRIPRVNMKGKRTYHIVPLAIQALAILKELHAVTGQSRYVFPKLGDPSKTMMLKLLGQVKE